MPFFLGFLSLIAKKHGIEPTVEFVRGMLGQLRPFDAGGASGNNLQYAWDMVGLALSDAANEGMIFGSPLQSAWGNGKIWLFTACVVVLAGWGIFAAKRKIPGLRPCCPPGCRCRSSGWRRCSGTVYGHTISACWCPSRTC